MIMLVFSELGFYGVIIGVGIVGVLLRLIPGRGVEPRNPFFNIALVFIINITV
jgi:hypothetical protein